MFAVRTDGLTKDYRQGFWRPKPKRVLEGLNLRVRRSEVFGLLGPNGAGKSTTLKVLLGLVTPTVGSAEILGRPLGDARVRGRIGYLPENPCFYDHLSPEEFLDYSAGLFGIAGAARRRRVGNLLERVGLEDSRRTPMGKLSKGMVERLGIAQALVNDPELLFLDEPMSGLDPLGRRVVRDLILELRGRGKTVVFSTHILPDAEMLCDRVAILNRGRLEGSGGLAELLSRGTEAVEIVLDRPAPELLEALQPSISGVVWMGDRIRLTLPADVDLDAALGLMLRERARIVSVNPVKVSLEDYFLRRVQDTAASGAAEPKASEPEASNSPVRPDHGPASDAAMMAEEESSSTAGSSGSIELAESASATPAAVRRVAVVAVHTFKDAVRDQVLYSLIVFALLLIGTAILFGSVSVGIERIMLVNLSLSAISVIGLVMAVFIGVGLVSKEIERRSVASVLSKPVRRAEFILGKYAGLLLTLAVNTAIMTAGFYAALFAQQRGLGGDALAPLEAVYFILLELALVVGVAVVFSCLSSPALSAALTLAVYLAGNLSSDLVGFGRESGSAILERVTTGLYYLLPNFSDFSVIAQAAHGVRIPASVVVLDSLYALVYGLILVLIAILIFERREFA